MSAIDDFGGPHEDVETAYALERAGTVRHDPSVGTDRATAKDPTRPMEAPVDGRVDAVEDLFDLRLVLLRKAAPLKRSGRVPDVAVLQVQQDHRVSHPSSQALLLGRYEVGTEVDVPAVRVIVVLEIVDDRRVEKFAEEDRRAEAGVSDHQIRFEIGLRLYGVIDPFRMGYGVLERPGGE